MLFDACGTNRRRGRGYRSLVSDLSFWGEIAPNWIAAVGTAGATSVAVYLAWQERRRAERAEAERDELREAAVAGVASRVAGWLTETPVSDEDRRFRTFRDAEREQWRAVVKNASDQAILNVKAYAVHSDGGHLVRIGDWPVVPPLETVHEDYSGQIIGYNEKPYLRVTFEDPEGRRWVRGDKGRLRIATEHDDQESDY